MGVHMGQVEFLARTAVVNGRVWISRAPARPEGWPPESSSLSTADWDYLGRIEHFQTLAGLLPAGARRWKPEGPPAEWGKDFADLEAQALEIMDARAHDQRSEDEKTTVLRYLSRVRSPLAA